MEAAMLEQDVRTLGILDAHDRASGAKNKR
jgi:hypothetical protein